MAKSIVSVEWLNENLENSDLIILDASQENNKSNLSTKFKNTKITGARYFDIKNAFSDTKSKYPNTLPKPLDFEIECRKLGINNSSKIIVYDNLGIYSSPRVWWMFKTMGHENIAVLNGGLPEWIKKEYKTENIQDSTFKEGNFKAQFRPENVQDYDFIKKNLKSEEALVIDARSESRFKALTPEPRKGLKGGNIPKSINIPFLNVLENGKFKSNEEITKIFSKANLSDKKLVFSCGSGITACILFLASELVLENDKAVYDGSWTEWSLKEN